MATDTVTGWPVTGRPVLGFAVYPLRVICRAVEPVLLPTFAGSAVRGALFGAVRDLACVNPAAPSCAACPLHRVCGAALLLATVDEQGPRGREVPRPFALRPPLDGGRVVQPGERFTFGVTLIGEEALRLLPYLVLGLRRVGEVGMGRPVVMDRGDGAAARRGRFQVEALLQVNPLTGARQTVMRAGDALVTLPDAPVTHTQVMEWCAARGSVSRLTLRLRTPLRLVVDGKLVQRLTFSLVMQRICRRLTDLERSYGRADGLDFREVLARAADVEVVEDRTRWLDLESKSSRQGRTVPIGGLVGSVGFTGELTPFLPWLVWAELVGVGKDVTKGNGVIELALATSG
jgi:hypothetical protein